MLAAEGMLLAVVGGFQYATGELFWNDKVIEGNEAHPYFRINSLFWDPNILGRYLAVTMTALAAVVAFGRERRELIGGVRRLRRRCWRPCPTFSQSSTIALIGGMLVLVAARWGMAVGVGAGLVALLALAASLALIGGDGLTAESSGPQLRSSTAGSRSERTRRSRAPGSGSFADEFEERFGAEEGFALESHTEPVTVFAEQGVIGLLAYAALLVVTVGGTAPGNGPAPDAAARRPAAGGRAAGDLRGDDRPQPRLRRLPHRPRHLGDPGDRRRRPRPGPARPPATRSPKPAPG